MSNLTQRDNNQIERHEHNEILDAKRVYIVGGGEIRLETDSSEISKKVAEGIKEGLADLLSNLKLEETQKIQIIEKPVLIKEPQIIEVEKQIVVIQKELVYIDKPVIIEKIVYKEIEKPFIIKENAQIQAQPQTKNIINPLIIAALALQTITIIGLVLLKL
jgi:hypothetical protein